ncbi:hypothetical protein DWUX_2095 [Desulfovibrio diazotrophicus]|nr:hypothetical protein DWUX_2095 [Desulfovibrio diazotrophicus]
MARRRHNLTKNHKKAVSLLRLTACFLMVRPARFELTTFGSGGQLSIFTPSFINFFYFIILIDCKIVFLHFVLYFAIKSQAQGWK